MLMKDAEDDYGYTVESSESEADDAEVAEQAEDGDSDDFGPEDDGGLGLVPDVELGYGDL